MKKEVLFYRGISGSNPIEDFLDALAAKQAKKVTWVLKLIEDLDPVPGEYFKKLSGSDDIWEVRIREGGDSIRLLGFWYKRSFIVLVHAFKKKSQKIKRSDIDLAESRKKEYLSRVKK